jgi:hypothetical protein
MVIKRARASRELLDQRAKSFSNQHPRRGVVQNTSQLHRWPHVEQHHNRIAITTP